LKKYFGGMGMKTKVFVLLSFAVLTFAGCATLPDATAENSTLLVGEIVEKGKGYTTSGAASVNGIHKSGVILTIQNTATYEVYELKSKAAGMLVSNKIPPGTYLIEKLFLKVESGSNWKSVWKSFDGGVGTFEVLADKVNNIGFIEWLAERISEDKVTHTINFYENYGETREAFRKKYEKSNWNEKEWSDVTIEKK
jgi:hypothetical protein